MRDGCHLGLVEWHDHTDAAQFEFSSGREVSGQGALGHAVALQDVALESFDDLFDGDGADGRRRRDDAPQRRQIVVGHSRVFGQQNGYGRH